MVPYDENNTDNRGLSASSGEAGSFPKRTKLLGFVQRDLYRLEQLKRETKELEKRSISELSHVIDFLNQDDKLVSRAGLAVTLTFKTPELVAGDPSGKSHYLKFDIKDPQAIRELLEQAVGIIYGGS